MASNGQHNEVIVEQILKALKAEQHGDNRWRGLCPHHDDHSPSLDIYINADGYPGFSCLSKHCKHVDIVKALKTKFNITVPSRKSSNSNDKVQSAKVLYPAHEPTFPLHMRKDEDTIYEYVTSSGEPAFFVQRYMDGKNKQTPAWFSVEYVSDGGRVERAWSSKDPPNKDRPLYNLYELTQNPEKKVLIVEGEKTADAAADYKQLVDFVVVTWSGGAHRVKASDWSVLRDRATEIYLWPDHDADGIKAMKEVAKYINNGTDDQRISLLDFSEFIEQRIDKGWDLADGCANMICDYPFEELWGGFKPYYVNERVTNETLEEALAKRDQYYRKVHIGGKQITVDLRIADEQSPFNVTWFDRVDSLISWDVERVTIEVGEKVKVVNAAREWYETRGSGPIMLHGTVFDPTTTVKEIIKEDGFKYLNTFPGFKTFPFKDGHDGLVKIFLDHIDGMIDDKGARDWIIDYFADIFQNPAKKPGTALALLGGQGVGKSVLIQIVAAVLGTKLTRIINKDFKNNIELAKSLLVIHDEWSINSFKEKPYYEALKNYITSPRIKVEAKYLSAWESDSFCRFAFTSNELRPIKLPPDDRRFTIIHCNRKWLGNKKHFEAIFNYIKNDAALAGLLAFFKNREIVSDLTTSYNTKQKEDLTEIENRVLKELVDWADGNGLPLYFDEKLGSNIANQMYEKEIFIPRRLMKEYIVNTYGKSAYSNAEIDMLKRITGFKQLRISIYDKRGGEFKSMERCFVIPPVKEFRANLERENGKPINWIDDELVLNPGVLDNVLEFKPKEEPKQEKPDPKDTDVL